MQLKIQNVAGLIHFFSCPYLSQHSSSGKIFSASVSVNNFSWFFCFFFCWHLFFVLLFHPCSLSLSLGSSDVAMWRLIMRHPAMWLSCGILFVDTLCMWELIDVFVLYFCNFIALHAESGETTNSLLVLKDRLLLSLTSAYTLSYKIKLKQIIWLRLDCWKWFNICIFTVNE